MLIDIADLEKVLLVVRSARGMEPCPEMTVEVFFSSCPVHLPSILVQGISDKRQEDRALGIEAPMMLTP